MKNHAKRYGLGVLLSLLGLGFTGCVERKITIASDPPGALVLLNDVEVGRTPVTVPFTWYGDYDVRLRLEKNVGTPEKPVMKHYYLHTHKRAQAPWFQWLGVDLVTELSPGELVDEQVWAFALSEIVEPSDEELLERAGALKAELDRENELKSRQK